jgi:hypothetical protein
MRSQNEIYQSKLRSMLNEQDSEISILQKNKTCFNKQG